jgi:hypothetical protein
MTVPHVDVYDLCGLAGRTVTRAYRAGLPNAHALDDAHARLVRRTGLRGTLPADDPDVILIASAALALDDHDRERVAGEHAATSDPHPTTVEPEARAGSDIAAWLLATADEHPTADQVAEAVARIDANRPALGALRAQRRGPRPHDPRTCPWCAPRRSTT